MNSDADSVLDFWFGRLENPTDFPTDKASMWFGNGAAYDEIIKQRFSSLYEKACNDELTEWQSTPDTLLALVILLDQFSRHIHRNTARSFAQDRKAVALVQLAIEQRFDRSLYFIHRKFLYMPLMHAEDLSIQDLCVEKFTGLLNEVPDELKELYAKSLSFAQSHHYVISRFGRFPELNQILNRQSTEEEKSFLDSGKYQFL